MNDLALGFYVFIFLGSIACVLLGLASAPWWVYVLALGWIGLMIKVMQ